MFIFGEKIFLRALEPNDVELLYQWENDPEIWQISQTLTPFSRFTLKQFVNTAQEDIFAAKQLRLMINDQAKKQTIGIIDIFDIDPLNLRAGIGILIHRDFRQQGIATETLQLCTNYLFKTFFLHQIYANVLAENEISLALFSKCGFEIVGTKRDWIKTANGFNDVVLMQKINLIKFSTMQNSKIHN